MQRRQRLVDQSGALESDAEREVFVHIAGVEADRFLVGGEGGVEVAVSEGAVGELDVGLRERAVGEAFADGCQRLGGVTGGVELLGADEARFGAGRSMRGRVSSGTVFSLSSRGCEALTHPRS
jgi:hypothetical protein